MNKRPDGMIPHDVEAAQRQFYALDGQTVDRLVREVIDQELSVVHGGILDQFEARAAELFGGRASVAACNGTAAIHLALFALDLEPGDEIIIPTYAYYGTALPICMVGAVPVFCDIRADDLTPDPADIEARITPRTRAILAHQPWGCPADAEALRALADKHDIALISDSSHAQGAMWGDRPHGVYYDIVCASLGKGKLVSGGELGVAVANDARHLDRMLLFGHVNRIPGAFRTDEYRHMQNSVGVKYRPHTFALALAMAQLATYRERSDRLVANIRRFEAGLEDIEGFDTFACPQPADRVYWRVPLRLTAERVGAVDSVIARFHRSGCPVVMEKSRRLVHEHNALTDFYGIRAAGPYPVAQQVVKDTVLLNAFSFVRDDAAERALDALRAISLGTAK